MGARKKSMKLEIPVKLPADTSGIEVDFNTMGATGSQVVVTFLKDDGTRVIKKGNMPVITETGITLTLK